MLSKARQAGAQGAKQRAGHAKRAKPSGRRSATATTPRVGHPHVPTMTLRAGHPCAPIQPRNSTSSKKV